MSSIKKNLGYQTVYQILNTCLPLITAPYLSRILGATQLGVQSYLSSVSSYFVLFAMLGIVSYGTRTIAADSKRKGDISKSFCEIYGIQMVCSLLMVALYLCYCLTIKENQLIVFIQGIAVISCLFDIGWLFFGLEQFRITVTRNIIVRLITVALTLMLVKTEGDLWKYVLIMTMSTLVNNLILWFYLKGRIRFYRPSLGDIKKHWKPVLVLFVPLLALSVYHLMDKTMLGMLSTYEQSGFYYNSDKVINIPIGVLTGVGTVLLPRITVLIEQNKTDEANSLFGVSIEGIILVASAITFGIAAVSREFIPFFFGDGYDECILLTIVLSPVLIFKSLSLTARNAYLIPHQKDKCFVYSVVLGALVNLIVNAILIPNYGAMGAVIGTLIAEVTSCIWQYVVICKEVNIFRQFANGVIFVAIGAIMFIVVRFTSSLLSWPVIVKLFIEIATGMITFCLLTVLYLIVSKNHLLKEFKNKR